MPYGTRGARVITSLLHEQLAKDLFLCCVAKKRRYITQKAYRAAILLGRARKRLDRLILKLTFDHRQSSIASKTDSLSIHEEVAAGALVKYTARQI